MPRGAGRFVCPRVRSPVAAPPFAHCPPHRMSRGTLGPAPAARRQRAPQAMCGPCVDRFR
ncbi:hypothetical protein AQ938_16110 [Burkholderia pseudomallei]|nr:hypothetical protein BURPSS13_T0294 [Burkholderia pseudomallei S13]EES22324.1 hypothetical protein BURPS1106B_0818 [Burkholderia pseudomallei 1106b]KIX55849.1 hypothetical protein SZ31_21235 [Burkholderia pseudomallei]OMQ53635.1 hypothetical protein AQ710_29920 [Burkholderia pseudomallei]OMQ54829.1 hypothetical protein AQ708_29340 [Burkholderia pseudomallei]